MKKLTLILIGIFFILLYFSNLSFAQYQRDWNRSYNNPPGGGLQTYITAMDKHGNLYLSSSCNCVNPNCGVFLMKYDSLGYLQWQQTVGPLWTPEVPRDLKISESGYLYLLTGNAYNYSKITKLDLYGDSIWSIVDTAFSLSPSKMNFDNMGNIIVTGQYLDSSSIFHTIITKYDTTGNVLWRKKNLLVNSGLGSDILVDSFNNIYTTIGNTLSKYTSLGNELWSITVDLWGVSEMIFDLQDNLYLVGTTNSTHIIGIYKFDTLGSQLWFRSKGPGDGGAISVVTDNVNNVYVSGITNSGPNPNIVGNSVLLKYNSSGSLIWSKTYNGTATIGSNYPENFAHIKTLKENIFLLYGTLYNTTTLNDGFLAKIDTAGNILWQDIYDSNYVNHKCEGWNYLNLDNDSNIYVTGTTGTTLGSSINTVAIMKYNRGYTGLQPSVQGVLYHDANQNCAMDSVDFKLPGKMISLMDSSYYILNYSLTDTGGNYHFYAPMGHYIVAPVPPQYWLSTCNGGLNVTLISNTDSSYNNDLGIFMQSDIQDLRISVAGGIINPGQNTNYFIYGENQGTDTISGRIIINHDPVLSYISAYPLPDSISTNRLVWNYSNLMSGQSKQIQFTLYADSTLTLLSPIETMIAEIEPVTSDLTPADNIDSLQICVFGPFDPNHKSVNQKDTVYLNDTLFTYLIQFQNLGNDTACNVVLRDTLSDQFLLNTLKMGAASFPYSVRFIGNVMFIKFTGISLPPESVNVAGSQGFIKYSINRKLNVTEGKRINNSAAIYFDYMPAILTNKTVNIYFTAPNYFAEYNFNNQYFVYPNPTTGIVNIQNNDISKKMFVMSIRNILGQMLITEKIEIDKTFQFDLSKLSNGIYFLILQNEKENYMCKVVLQQ